MHHLEHRDEEARSRICSALLLECLVWWDLNIPHIGGRPFENEKRFSSSPIADTLAYLIPGWKVGQKFSESVQSESWQWH